MWRFPEITAKRALICLALLGAGVMASVVAGPGGPSIPPPAAPRPAAPEPSPSDTVASRFPSAWTAPSPAILPAGLQPRVDAQEQLALFSPNPTYPAGWGLPQMPDALNTMSAPSPLPESRNGGRSNALFNDAQITAIRNRLNLTSNQQQYWPPVEQALRDIAWQKPAAKGRPRTIDPNSRAVQRLKSAAAALVPSLNEEQKRELRLLAGLIGLQSVAAQF